MNLTADTTQSPDKSMPLNDTVDNILKTIEEVQEEAPPLTQSLAQQDQEMKSVADSDPEDDYKDTMQKMQAMHILAHELKTESTQAELIVYYKKAYNHHKRQMEHFRALLADCAKAFTTDIDEPKF